MALSAGLHLAILLFGWSSTLFAPEMMEFVTYEIELVSPPPARQAEEPAPAREELVVERPDPEPLPPEPEVEEIVPVEEPDPEPEPEPEPVEEPVEEVPPEVDEAPVVAATEEPVEEEPELSGEGLNVRIEGLRRDYPQYYNNIIRQIQRCFRWRDGGSWETTVFFYIDREGNAEGIEFVSRSGSTAFDFEAMGAVECAGRGRFGPLPDDLPYDRFPVRFSFQPMGEPAMALPTAPRPTEVTFSR
jgi:outer membrane biosynthesis protein TonB